jgi:oligopeptide transport system substrate-binding protein
MNKNRSKTVLLILSCLLIIILASAACIPISLPGPLPSPSTPSRTGSTLNLADSGPITLDPALTADLGSAQYVMQIFGGLVKLDEKLKIAPDIAQSWDKSSDGTIFTFHLRNDAKFHSGKQVTAADVKYSWERALNPATQSLTAGTYLNDIVGSAEVLAGNTAQLSGVKVVDDYTLQVTIDAPKAYFLDKMAYPTSFIVDKANVASGANWWQHPNGTGPFKLSQWIRDQVLTLQRNDSFYGDKAALSTVVFNLFSGNPLQSYQQGDIDVSPVYPDYMGLVTDPSNPASKELNEFPELSFSYIGINSSKPPFDDVNVRQAFACAIDKSRINNLSDKGTVTVANGILPPGMPGFNPVFQGIAFDPAKAKSLIASSKYGSVSKLPPIVVTTAGWGNNISGTLGGVINEWRRNLGVEVSVRQLEPEIFYYQLSKEKNNLFDSGWVADYPDPQDFLDVLFRTGAQNNSGGYSNLKLDALLDKAAVEQNVDARLKMYQDAEQMLILDGGVIPLSFGRSFVLVKPYVKGYFESPLGFPLLNKVSIQK